MDEIAELPPGHCGLPLACRDENVLFVLAGQLYPAVPRDAKLVISYPDVARREPGIFNQIEVLIYFNNINEMLDPANFRHPRVAGWKSIIQLCREGATGGSHAMRARVERLREGLIDSLTQGGTPESDARARVASEFIRQVGPALYVSPDAVTLLDLKLSALKAPPSWRSAGQLVRLGEARGGQPDLLRKLKSARNSLVRDVAEQLAIQPGESEVLVNHNLVGVRRTGFGDDEALYASPDTLRWLKDEGTLKPRDLGPNDPKLSSQS